MIVLGFDTATLSTAVGLLLADGSALAARDDPREGSHPGHATRLLGMANELLAEADLAWSDLDRIAVGLGPGRFTGLRVGIATARGLAQSLSAELVGVSSLRALAAGAAAAGAQGCGEVLAVIDARRGEAFAAAYSASDQGSAGELVFAEALTPAALEGIVVHAQQSAAERGLQWLAVGDGAVRYRNQLERGGATVPADASSLHLVDPRAICELGASAQVAPSLTDVLPDYRRPADADMARGGIAVLEGSKP
jgi:tRNA threonylcarbamoyladenosine biosynthesis protein TsaB